MKNWLIFIRERFPLLKHIPLIVFFFWANVFIALGSFQQMEWKWGVSFVVIFLAFFHLRIFDEIKDYETDLIIHPERPLARGLISVREAKIAAFILCCVELGLALSLGLSAFLAASCFILYSLLMYKEFFVGSWLRPKLATYALTHTVISGWLALFIFSAVTGQNFWEVPKSFAFFVFANWMVFNIFEFGRKTFGKEEEKPLIESYSKNFGSWGAALIVLAFAILAAASLFLLIPLSIVCVFYGHLNSALWAKRFRFTCSSFILFYYMSIPL
jgi:4-hydroxybenzoate polyprenyltransferase